MLDDARRDAEATRRESQIEAREQAVKLRTEPGPRTQPEGEEHAADPCCDSDQDCRNDGHRRSPQATSRHGANFAIGARDSHGGEPENLSSGRLGSVPGTVEHREIGDGGWIQKAHDLQKARVMQAET